MSRQTHKEMKGSFHSSFNMPGSSLVEEEAACVESSEEKELSDEEEMSSECSSRPSKKRKILVESSDEEDEEDEAEDEDYTKDRYDADYSNVMSGVFKKSGITEGKNWSGFKKELDKIVLAGKIDMKEDQFPVYMHIMCRQYAKATGLTSGKAWETMDSMKPLYKKGLLKKLGGAGKSKASGFNFSCSQPAEDDESEFVTTKSYIETVGLSGFSGLDMILQGLISKPSHEMSKKSPGFKLYADIDGFSQHMPEAALSWMKKNKSGGGRSSPTAQSSYSAPRPVALTTSTSSETLDSLRIPDDELPEPEQTEWGQRIWWKSHIINEEPLQMIIEDHINKDYIFRRLSSRDFLVDNAQDAVNQIAKNCGGKMWKKRNRQKIKIPRDEDNKSVYVMGDRDDMWMIYTDQLKLLKII